MIDVALGRVISLVTTPAHDPQFKVAAEMMVGHTGGLVPDAEVDAEDHGTQFVPGDVLFSKLRPYLTKVWRADRTGGAVGDIHVYRPGSDVASEYLNYILLSSWFIEQVTAATYGTKMPRASWDFIKTIRIPTPPINAQRAIADFLDHETAEIDLLIEKQTTLIDRLRERRDALVERAVADESLPRQPLGATTSLIQTGPFGSQLSADAYVDDGTPVLNPLHFAGGIVRPDPAVSVDRATAERLRRHALMEGDLIAARRGELGRAAVISQQHVGSLVGTGSLVVRPKPSHWDSRFLHRTFTSRRTADLLSQMSVGSTMPNLNTGMISRLRLPCPAMDEQRRIANHLDRETAKVDELIAKAERFIELTKERRSALITAAVTGQIDVASMGAA